MAYLAFFLHEISWIKFFVVCYGRGTHSNWPICPIRHFKWIIIIYVKRNLNKLLKIVVVIVGTEVVVKVLCLQVESISEETYWTNQINFKSITEQVQLGEHITSNSSEALAKLRAFLGSVGDNL